LLTKTEIKEDFDFISNDPLRVIVEFIPHASKIEKTNYLNKWSIVYDSTGTQLGKYLISSPFCDNIIGYGGCIPLVIIADKNERITGIGLLPCRETPAWISGLKNIKFFDSWNGKTLSEIKDLKIDAVTGATYTSVAVREIIAKRSAIYTGSLKYEKAKQKSSIKWIEDAYSPVLYLILLASLIALFIKKLNRYRIYFQLASIIFFGIISGKFISIYFLENISANGTAIFTSFVTVFLVGFSIIIPLVINKHWYCYYICPFGGVQTLLGKIPVKKVYVAPNKIKFFRTLRLIIFVFLLISITAGMNLDLTLVEPFTVFIFYSASITVIAGSIVIFTASLFVKNPWCVYLCPTGQLFDLLKDGIYFKRFKIYKGKKQNNNCIKK